MSIFPDQCSTQKVAEFGNNHSRFDQPNIPSGGRSTINLHLRSPYNLWFDMPDPIQSMLLTSNASSIPIDV